MDDLLPEPLFQTNYIEGSHVCLACANGLATTMLREALHNKEIVPLCNDCSSDWNIYSYYILKRIKPTKLLFNLAKFKILHPFKSPPTSVIIGDISRMNRWAKKMRKFKL